MRSSVDGLVRPSRPSTERKFGFDDELLGPSLEVAAADRNDASSESDGT
jgi:hypothetical protein